eukprot:2024573-Amphidinium_carterae.1
MLRLLVCSWQCVRKLVHMLRSGNRKQKDSGRSASCRGLDLWEPKMGLRRYTTVCVETARGVVSRHKLWGMVATPVIEARQMRCAHEL